MYVCSTTNLHQSLVRVDYNVKKYKFVIFRPINASYSALQFIWLVSKDWLKRSDPRNVKAGRTHWSHKSKTCLCYYYTTNLHQTSVRVDYNDKKPRFFIFRRLNKSYSELQFIWLISKDWLKRPDPWKCQGWKNPLKS